MNKVFEQHLNETEINSLSRAVYLGYWAVDKMYKIYPVLGNFLPGRDLRPNLINVAVQFELCKIAISGFNNKIELNAAKNCNHALLLKDGLKITAHYLGSTKPRKMARSAICRSPYAAVNSDIFAVFGAEDDASVVSKDLYCHLYHSGLQKPELVWLAAPDDSQKGIIGSSLMLPTIEIEKLEKTEEIMDTIEHTLKAGVQHNEHQQQLKESNG
ncbi:MAG: hypothetical protein WC856_23625 [Methylococcaceae bacterium]|jgi:hypothetical protein